METSTDKNQWNLVLANGQSSGLGFVTHDVSDGDARYLRIVGHGHSLATNGWNSLIEIQVRGCGSTPTPTPTPDPGDLDPNLTPSENFDLTAWYVSVPIDQDNNGKADNIKENELNGGYQDSRFFYSGSDGGMVFNCPIKGYKTSAGNICILTRVSAIKTTPAMTMTTCKQLFMH